MKLLPLRQAVPAAIVFLMSAGEALAQSDAGALLNEQQRQKQILPDHVPSNDLGPLRPALKEEGVKITLRAVRFSGALKLAPESELQAVVADSIGREIGFRGLQQIAARVTELLHKKGFFLARAYLPQQDVTEGKLEVALLEGHLDGKEGNGAPYLIVMNQEYPPRINPDRVSAIVGDHLTPGAAVSDRDMERTVLLLNDLPGVNTQARLEAGQEPDSTHVVIDVQEGPLASGSVVLDNEGNANTGTAQVTVSAELNDPLRIGDQLSVGETHSQGIDFARIGYAIPLGYNGVRLSGSWAHMNYSLDDGAGEAAGLKGNSNSGNIGLTYPFIRSRMLNVYGALGYAYKSLVDDSVAGELDDKRINEWNIGLSGNSLDNWGGGGYMAWNLAFTQGKLDLSANAASAASDALGYQSQGDFNKLNFGFSRLQKLPANFTFSTSFSGQTASKNLDSSEKFILGGPNGVRAYPGSEGLGDSGLLVNLELHYDVPIDSPIGRWQLVSFYDNGHIEMHDNTDNIPIPTATGENSYSLSGWGLGVNLSKTNRYSIRLSWSQKIGDNPGRSTNGLDTDGRADHSRFWLQASISL